MGYCAGRDLSELTRVLKKSTFVCPTRTFQPRKELKLYFYMEHHIEYLHRKRDSFRFYIPWVGFLYWARKWKQLVTHAAEICDNIFVSHLRAEFSAAIILRRDKQSRLACSLKEWFFSFISKNPRGYVSSLTIWWGMGTRRRTLRSCGCSGRSERSAECSVATPSNPRVFIWPSNTMPENLPRLASTYWIGGMHRTFLTRALGYSPLYGLAFP